MDSTSPNLPPAMLITGASRGLGRGIALEAAARGWSVLINYAGNKKAAEEAIALCRERAQAERQRFLPIQGDVSRGDDRKRMVETAFTEFGDAFTTLVNNAGVAPKERLDILEAGEESFQRLMDINLKGPYFLTRDVSARWVKAGARERSVIFVSSISAEIASVNRGEYCVSKAGIGMAAKLFAARLAEEGIQVYEVRPGIMATDMTAGVKEKYEALFAEGLVPQGRWGTAEDTGKAVLSLAEGQFPFSPGNVFYVDGGIHLPRL